MRDKVDELFDIIGMNRKNLIYVIIVYIIIISSIIVIIWWPESDKHMTYQKVDIESKKTQMAQNYIYILTNIFKNKDTQELKKLIPNSYIEYTGSTLDKIVSNIENEGFFSNNVEFRGINIYQDGDTYVYSTTMYSENNSKTINIIERYPYDYEIVFDDFYSYEELGIYSINQNIKFTVNDVYRNLKYIEFNMKIENQNQSYAKFDFNSTVGVQAILEDGTSYALANLVSTEQYTNIEPNMTVNKNFVFEIPAQLQEGIEYIVFNGITLEFSTINVKINV